MRLCRNRFSWLPAMLLLGASALPAQQERARQYQFAIPKGSLPSALGQFSKQTGLQIITQLNVSESETDEISPSWVAPAPMTRLQNC